MMKFLAFLFFFCFTPALFAQVVNIEDQRITGTRDSVHWYGEANASASYAKVKDESLELQAEAKVEYKSGRHLVLFLLKANLLRADNSDFARQAFAHLRYNYKINKTWTWEAFSQIQTSPIQSLEQRNLVGTGMRYTLFKSKDGSSRMYLGSAFLWEENHFTGETGYSYRNRSSNYFTATFQPNKRFLLVQTTYWQPVIGLIRNYRLSTQWVFKMNLGKKLQYVLEFDYGVDKNLPPGAPGETVAVRNGISLEL